MDMFEKFSILNNSVKPVYDNSVRVIDKPHQCAHGDLCRAYIKKFGNSFNMRIYFNTCPNCCEFYKPKE